MHVIVLNFVAQPTLSGEWLGSIASLKMGFSGLRGVARASPEVATDVHDSNHHEGRDMRFTNGFQSGCVLIIDCFLASQL